ncbi:MAG TPA: MFS transporter [Candidatus Dormibacteraeota bacterium]|jgi:MFS family permease|nr:MFS transporter [Candidatus Dormibacteraeota bacterium]
MFGGRLWRDGEFLKLWSGQAISEIGSQVSLLALPTVAILVLGATPFQVGLLAACENLAFPVLGLVAGVYVDRLRRRPIMIACDVGRLLALASVPIAFALNVLSMPQLYAVALIAGVGTVFFDVAYQSYLPALIPRADLIEGNTKLQVTSSVAQMAGPALGGVLIQLIGPARAVAADAASFLISVVSLLWIRRPEPTPSPMGESGRRGFFVEMWEGIRVVFGNSTIWKIAGSTSTSNLGSNLFFAVFLIFVYRVLHLSPGTVGIVFAAGAVGGLLGAFTAAWIPRRIGLGPTLFVTIVLGGLSLILVPIAQYGFAVPLLFASMFIGSFVNPVYNINQVSLRQAIVPDRVQGRMNATVRTIIWGTNPIGAFIGGIIGSTYGIVPALYAGIGVSLLAGFWILLGPIRLRVQPEPV